MAGLYAFVTLVSSDAYLPGALAQAAALRDVHPSPPTLPEVPFQTVCLVTPETVDVTTIKLLRRAFDVVIGVEVLGQENNKNLQLLGRPDLTTVLTKLHVFRLTQYSKIVFLDADVLPIRPLSHLFNISHDFAAAPDVGWPDIFNSGVLVLSPGEDKFDELNQFLKTKGSWDGGDQGLLNEWRAGDWYRLSFTYNTTPTAAYTYAPAYERFGSQINAIHFIGPSKPWNAIPFRSPFLAEKRATSSTTEPQSSPQAYDYDSLVDRWFAVYDRHYRSQPIITPSFEVKRYPSAWHSPSSVVASDPTTGKPFTLEVLRKIAIDGMSVAGFEIPSFAGQAGEGEYRTLPLEGRFDLMQPRKPPPESEEDSSSTPGATLSPEPKLEGDYFDPSERDLPMTPMARHLDLPDGPVLWRTLPTPGPNEHPPSPKIPLKSLPTTPTPASDYYASSAGQTSDSEGWTSSGTRAGPTSPFPSHLFTQTPQPPRPSSQKVSHEELSYFQHHHHDHNYSHPHHHHQNGPAPRPPSPPLLPWNPAVEPPPNDPPPPSKFPVDTYFTNVWDESYRKELSPPQKGSHGHPTLFFDAPPPPQIPESLREQGHYRNITGEGLSGSATNPDPTKVKPVFPWEDQPRRMPGRVFPDSEAPSPTRFINLPKPLTPPTPTPAPKPSEKSRSMKRQSSSPIQKTPTSLSYSNAWDIDPSIQNYASRLVRPPPAPSGRPPGVDLWGNHGYKNWDEKSEASSRDGDDEDEGDEEEGRDVDSDDERRSRPRARSSSPAEDTRQAQKSLQKSYRSLGVQTIPREKRSQSVQVSTLVEAPSRPTSRRSSISSKRSTVNGGNSSNIQGRDATRTPEFLVKPGSSSAPGSVRSRSISNGSFGYSPPLEHATRPQRDFITPPLSQTPRPLARSFPPHIPEPPRLSTPAQAGTPRLVTPSVKATPPPKIPSPPIRPSIQTNRQGLNTAKALSISHRQISNDSSIGSPPSSLGPASPPDDQPFTPSARKGTRVWDPARGVELFKRGSEEVLARFLKMGSWDENTR
ncbi:Glycogenin-1 [Leucoagaricus sp. SymC.cos]|nr:Glycogenin-1 [Leucoagaricus sp. SymC.cos]